MSLVGGEEEVVFVVVVVYAKWDSSSGAKVSPGL